MCRVTVRTVKHSTGGWRKDFSRRRMMPRASPNLLLSTPRLRESVATCLENSVPSGGRSARRG
eukprot:5091956-Prymnesium_polylepis.1